MDVGEECPDGHASTVPTRESQLSGMNVTSLPSVNVPSVATNEGYSLPPSSEEYDLEESHELDEPNSLTFNGKLYWDLEEADLKGQVFKSYEAAEAFYTRYAKAVGFSVRKDRLQDVMVGNVKCVKKRNWVCSKQGRREQKWIDMPNRSQTHRPLTRDMCFASFEVASPNAIDSYVVTKFSPAHSHEVVSEKHSSYLRSHRTVTDADAALATVLKSACIKPSHTFQYMVDQAGGYQNVGFNMKDLHNRMNRDHREELLNGDAESAISYLRVKASTDLGFYLKYQVDEQGRLTSVFWRDSESLSDYAAYGDVLLFDSTYKTNMYGMPLVLFVGINNHRLNVVFGSALIPNETTETFTWLLETFLESMNNKRPGAVVTDGDEAMRNAIDIVLHDAKHRVCSWHIMKNFKDHFHISGLASRMHRCMKARCTLEEFEVLWDSMLTEFGLHNDEYMQRLYDRADRWAECKFMGYFLGHTSSTQRCESLNSCMKNFMNHQYRKLYDCLQQLDRSLNRIRNNAAVVEFRGLNSTPVCTTSLRCYEKQAAIIFSEAVFYKIRRELEMIGGLNHGGPMVMGDIRLYSFSSFDSEIMRTSTIVVSPGQHECFRCTCKRFESEGIPCCHIFCAMRCENITVIPQSLIMDRWTKAPLRPISSVGPTHMMSRAAIECARYGGLGAEVKQLCFLGSKSEEGYKFVKAELRRLCAVAEAFLPKENEGGESDNCLESTRNVVRDPDIVRTKGNHTVDGRVNGQPKSKGLRHCSYCKEKFHNISTCPKKVADQTRKRGVDEGPIANQPHKKRTRKSPLAATSVPADDRPLFD